ncbi:MAG: HAD family hydrolase [Acholeplasmataceae bacterium]|nr:HAD family hydrolase [Acholeplasmataceae bacterium]
MKKLKGIIFDMDGTILNTIEDIADSINYALNIFNYPTHNIDTVKKALGNGGRNLVDQLVPKGLTEDQISEVFHLYQSYYNEHSAIKTRPYEGIIELLIELKHRGYILAVVSNKFQHLVSDLNQGMFKGLFDDAMGERKGIPIKPAPDMIYHILDELNLRKDEVIFIGDSEVDIETAKNADLKVIGVTWGFRNREELIHAGAKDLIDRPEELILWLERNR